jgi:phosphinothricin acetyltransferase
MDGGKNSLRLAPKQSGQDGRAMFSTERFLLNYRRWNRRGKPKNGDLPAGVVHFNVLGGYNDIQIAPGAPLLNPADMNVQFRFASPDDAAAVLAIYAPYCQDSHVSFEIVPPSESQMGDRIAGVLARYPWLIAEIDGKVAGYVYASQHRERAAYRWAVDVAVYIDAAHRRRGLARGLYRSLFSILREQGYFKAFAGITLPNPSSVGLHEALGFRPAGVFPGAGYKLGCWLDVGWWQLELQPVSPNPPEPTPFPAICNGRTVCVALAEGLACLRYNEP